MSSLAMDRTTTSKRPLSIVVLLGGWSTERAISSQSGRAVISALRSRGHDVRELDPAEIDLCTYPWFGVDVAFIALHGSFGEDGTVQSWLDEFQVPYTGSTARASRLAMSKSASKLLFRAQNLQTPEYHVVHATEPTLDWNAKAAEIGYPLVVKPDAQGSSIGVSIVHREELLADALALAFRYEPLSIVERYIPGRELTVAVLERSPLPVIEIRARRSFFDFDAKYQDHDTEYVFDSELPADAIERAQAAAVSAVDALGCNGVARVDLRLDEQHQPWLLEVNTIPGLTDHSLVPKAAARAGLAFADLCEQLVLAKLPTTSENRTNRAA